MALESSCDDDASGRPFVPVTARRIIARPPRRQSPGGQLYLANQPGQLMLAMVGRWARFAQQVAQSYDLATCSANARRASPPAFAPLPTLAPLVGPEEAPAVLPARRLPADLSGAPPQIERDGERADQPVFSSGVRLSHSPSAGNRSGDEVRIARQAVRPPEASRRILERMERSSPLVLDHHSRELIARLLRRHVPAVPIYANEAGDELTRAAGADALAYPDRIVIRREAYSPHSAAGLALLGHELTHVAAMHSQPAPEAPSAGAYAAEERDALRNERELLLLFAGHGSHTPPVSGYSPLVLPSPVDQAPPVASQPGPAAPPMPVLPVAVPVRAAATDRDLGLPPLTAPALSEAELRRIKEEVYSDLLRRIRTDFERGA